MVAPIVASYGLPVGKMSGRGLDSAGNAGQDGIHSRLSRGFERSRIYESVEEIGIVLTGQSGDLAPADGILYGLRDVTGTVPSTPLIASSIMSKKIAAGAQAIVLDVKLGYGAFMKRSGKCPRIGAANGADRSSAAESARFAFGYEPTIG